LQDTKTSFCCCEIGLVIRQTERGFTSTSFICTMMKLIAVYSTGIITGDGARCSNRKAEDQSRLGCSWGEWVRQNVKAEKARVVWVIGMGMVFDCRRMPFLHQLGFGNAINSTTWICGILQMPGTLTAKIDLCEH